eukprot:288642-Pyramimonas_sp.AAC.1
MPRNALLAPGCPGFLRFRCFLVYGKRDVPTPETHGRPGVSRVVFPVEGFLWTGLRCSGPEGA